MNADKEKQGSAMPEQDGWVKHCEEKYEALQSILSAYGKTAVAFSAGVDSTFLLFAAKQALGENVIAMTASTGTFPQRELEEAKACCEKMGVRHLVLPVNVFEIPGFSQNPEERCYICKKQLFSGFQDLARQEKVEVVAEGSNMDDMGDYRPGMRAIKELGIASPLRAAGLYKEEIRFLSRKYTLPTWDKPSYACLATRIPYGETITRQKLRRIEQAEELLFELGFRQCRVRDHNGLARIEVEEKDLLRFMEEEVRTKVNQGLKEAGFSYGTLDLQGYRSGSMNRNVKNRE